ncbi:MAG: hypothetical protein WC905_00990 [Patescibacteria group bacterium]|jgi:hypothetical protein
MNSRKQKKFFTTVTNFGLIAAISMFVLGIYIGLAGIALFSLAIGLAARSVADYYDFSSGKTTVIFLVTLAALSVGIYLAALLNTGGSIAFPTDFLSICGLTVGGLSFITTWTIVHWSIRKPIEETDHCNVVLVFAFGRDEETNEPLLRELERPLARHRTVCTQQSLYRQLPKNLQEVCLEIPQSSKEISTYGLIKEFEKMAVRNEWSNVGVIAARQHIKRCLRDLYREGFEVVPLRAVKVPFNIFDDLWQVRLPLFWWIRECTLLSLPYWLYKKISVMPIGTRRPIKKRPDLNH